MSTDLAGTVAVVAGSPGPRAGAVADGLRAAGAQVVTLDPPASTDEIGDAVEAIVTECGGIDVLVNDVDRRIPTPLDASRHDALRQFRAVFEANTRTPFLLGRAVVGSMIERGGGHIVNVTVADVLPPPDGGREQPSDQDAYLASKWALNGFTQAWALALTRNGIRVNALAVAPDQPAEDVAELLLALLAEGPDGRTGETIGWSAGDGATLPPRLARGQPIV